MQDWKRSEPCDNGSDEEQDDDDDDYDRILIKCLSALFKILLLICMFPICLPVLALWLRIPNIFLARR